MGLQSLKLPDGKNEKHDAENDSNNLGKDDLVRQKIDGEG